MVPLSDLLKLALARTWKKRFFVSGGGCGRVFAMFFFFVIVIKHSTYSFYFRHYFADFSPVWSVPLSVHFF